MTDTPHNASSAEAETVAHPQLPEKSAVEKLDATELLSGRYRIEAPLGEGAMGQVYEAEHVMMKKRVAIKILRRELTENDEMVARFQREAQAAASLDSPHVCQATDFGQTDNGAFFLVMEYLEGETLESTVNTFGRIEIPRALHVARQIATALQQAHSQGIVHRDLKPENIMLIERQGDPNSVKIMDFGIAHMVASVEENEDGPARLTRKGMVYGTPHYMAPEQVAGDTVDARTDIYALGVVLFEMLTGTPPFEGETIAVIMGKHVTHPAPSLASRCPEVDFPLELEALIATLLAKDCGDRPQSGAAVIASIDQVIESISEGSEKKVDFSDVSSMATRGMDAISRSARTTGGITVVSMEKLIGLILKGVEVGWALWDSLPRRGRRIAAVASFCITLLVVATVVLISLLMSGDRQARVIEDNRQSLLEDAAVIAAIEAAEEGDRAELDALLEEHANDAHLRYISFMTDLEAGRSVDRIAEAEAIIELDRRYANDEELIAIIVGRLHTNSDGEAAGALLAENFNATTRQAVSEIARTHPTRSRRDMAFEFLEEHNQLRRLEPWDRASVEFRQASGCTDNKEMIDKIVAIGDSRALSTLEAAAATPRRGCGPLRLNDCISCYRGDIRDAIEALSDE